MGTFRDIVGQAHIKTYLQRAIMENKVSHAYLFSGEEQMGKELLAKTFAQALLCEQPLVSETVPYYEPCNACASCKKIANDAHPDVRIVKHEKPLSIRVDEIEEQVVGDAALMPYAGDRKIYIIPEAQKMTVDAQNKMLKTLEEAPSYCTMLLLCDNANALLQTIRSRCVPLALRPAPAEEVVRFLEKAGNTNDYRIRLASRISRGNPGRALTLAQDARFEARMRALTLMMRHLSGKPLYEISEELEELLQESEDEKTVRDEFFETIRDLLRDIFIYKSCGNRQDLILEDQWEYIRDVALYTAYADLTAVLNRLQRTREQIATNVNAKIAMELFLLEASTCLHTSPSDGAAF